MTIACAHEAFLAVPGERPETNFQPNGYQMKKFLSLAICCLLLAGCVNTHPQLMNASSREGLAGKTLATTKRSSQPFIAMTAGKGMFALAGVGAAVAAGNDLVERNNVADPTIAITQAVAANYVSGNGMQLVEPARTVSSSKVSALISAAGDADYILDISPLGWGFNYLPGHFSQYHVGFSANMQLIEVRTGKVLASDSCIYNAKKLGREAVSYEELLANDAAYIKQELANAEAYCAEKFSPK